MRNFIVLIFAIIINTSGFSQAYLSPAPPQDQPIMIIGGTAHLGNGTVIENGVIAFENGQLTIVADPNNLPAFDESRYQVIDASGKHVYPGFIATNTQLGIKEISLVRATRDYAEVGGLNPNVRALIAYNTESRVIPTVRSNGVLMAQPTPVGGRISGSSSVVQLDAWNWEDAAYRVDDGIHLNWPSLYRSWWRPSSRPGNHNENYQKQLQEVKDFFDEAYAYSKRTNPTPTNLKFENMRGLFNGSKNLYIHADRAKAITEAVLFARNYQIKPVIVGGQESWLITGFLKTNGISLLLKHLHGMPIMTDEDYDQPYKTPALLYEAGIDFGIYLSNNDGFWEVRNLPFQAGQAAAFGLPYEAAVGAISLNVARILGVDATTGSLKEGKDATLFISEGDALDMRSCVVTHAFIQGRKIDLNNKQKMLYKKYMKKYKGSE